MTIIFKLIAITLATIISVSCEDCLKTCVYDMIDLKNKINEIKTCADDIKVLKVELEIQKNETRDLKEELEVQKNKIRDLEYELEHERNKTKGI